jgi:hypothetical protein
MIFIITRTRILRTQDLIKTTQNHRSWVLRIWVVVILEIIRTQTDSVRISIIKGYFKEGENSSAQPFGIELKRQADFPKYTSLFCFCTCFYEILDCLKYPLGIIIIDNLFFMTQIFLLTSLSLLSLYSLISQLSL